MRRLEVLKGLKATGQLEEEDRRGLLLSPPREEIGLLERQRQRQSKRFRSPNRIQQRVLKKERSHVDAEGVGKMRKKVGLEKRRRRNPSPTVKEEVGEKSVEEAPAIPIKGNQPFLFLPILGLQ